MQKSYGNTSPMQISSSIHLGNCYHKHQRVQILQHSICIHQHMKVTKIQFVSYLFTGRKRQSEKETGTDRDRERDRHVCLLVGCLTSQQQASVSQGRICSDNFTCCHTEIEVADPTFYLTQSQYTDTRPTSPSADPITPGAWQGSHWSANF